MAEFTLNLKMIFPVAPKRVGATVRFPITEGKCQPLSGKHVCNGPRLQQKICH
jgi:hypothetical protein